MINQVVPNSVQTRTFSDFSQPKNGWYLNTHPQEIEKKNQKKWGMTIAVSAMVAGFGTLALMKGALPKTAAKYLERLKIKLARKNAKGGKFQNFYRYSINKINSFLEKTESINNLTTLKDVLFQKLMFGKDGKRLFTRKIHQGITNFFNRISRKTVNSAYAKTDRKFATFNEYVTSLNQKLLEENPNNPTLKEVIEDIELRMILLNENLNKGFGLNARNERLLDMEKATDGLFDYFWGASFSDLKNFKSKRMFQTFIAENYILPHKMRMTKETGVLRRIISHNVLDNYKATMKAVDNIQKFIHPTDMETNSALEVIRQNMKKYKKLSGKKEATQREVLNKEICENLNKLSQTFHKQAKKHGYTPEATKSMSAYINEVNRIISDDSKGILQDISSLYKPYVSHKDFMKLKSHIHTVTKSLDNSINKETIQYFDKLRDLKLGSAPTDVLSIIGAVGAVGWFLGKSKDKDERISASLKYGIPAVGAIATSLYSTARLVSGGKAMALGLLSGWVMNKAGVVVDDMRKKYSIGVSVQKQNLKPQSDKV